MADDPQNSWTTARQAFDEGRIADALGSLKKDTEQHPNDPALLYNIGNLEFRLAHYGSARAYFKKAALLAPHSAAIRDAEAANERALRASSGQRDWSPAESWHEALNAHISLDYFALFFVILAAALGSVLKKKRKLMVIGTLVVASLFWTLARIDASTQRWICKDAVVGRSGPGTSYLQVGSVDPGVQLKVLAYSADQMWIQVALSGDEVAWVPLSSGLLLADPSIKGK